MEKLILFDVDKTLIKSIQMERDHWVKVFRKVYGVDVDMEKHIVNTHGFTHKKLVFFIRS